MAGADDRASAWADVDVGIVTYGAADVAVASIGRLLDVAPGIRVLVHDNASPDGTADAIAGAFPAVDVVRGVTNEGFAAGMNHLLARSRTPWFLALNPDAWPEPGAIERLRDVLVASPDVAAVAPLLLRPDGSVEHSTQPLPSVAVAARCAVGGYERLRPPLDRPSDVGWAVGAALLLRREAVDVVGNFDDRLFLYAEDLEWCWRAQEHGWRIRFEPAAVVRHIGGASTASTYGRRRTRAHLHNTYRVVRRRRGAATTALYRSLNVAGCARLYLQARLRGDGHGRAEWAEHVRAHLAPVRGDDAPPSW